MGHRPTCLANGFMSLSDLESPIKIHPLVLDKDGPSDIFVPSLIKYFLYFNLKKYNRHGRKNLGYDNYPYSIIFQSNSVRKPESCAF